jgi:hypothetical protein
VYSSGVENEGCGSIADTIPAWAQLELTKLVVNLSGINIETNKRYSYNRHLFTFLESKTRGVFVFQGQNIPELDIWMNGWMDGCMVGWMDGWKDR